jgi:pyruvate dehydrogenase E1 component alpha subunit
MNPIDPKLLIEFYRQMFLIRRFEERAAEQYALGKIGGFCHLYIGQEAVAVGAIAALREDDYVLSSYRDHGHCLAKGSDPKQVMAELFGRTTGLCKGKGGSMHLVDSARNFFGGYAIVGGHLPLAVGVAFAVKYRNKDQVVLCFFGEGAVPTGICHESLNMAALWKLPVVFVCENNRYGMGTPVERASAIYNIAQVASAYDMAKDSFDGMNVIDVYKQVKSAVEMVRTKQAPAFLEAKTYRFMGHSMSDPAHGHYRSKGEVDEAKKRDPIPALKKSLLEGKILTDAQLHTIEKEVQEIVDASVQFANASPEPPLESLEEGLYV